jgi:hypothetical protein
VAREHAQLSLRRTGGLAGLPMVASLDTRELEPEEAERIAGALDRVDLARVGHASPPPAGAADTFHYQLEVHRGEQTHAVHFDERQMPAELGPVVRTLMRRARPGR